MVFVEIKSAGSKTIFFWSLKIAFIALKPCLDSLASLSEEMNLSIAAISVAVTDILYTAALIAVKQWQGITLLAGRLCLQSNSARGSQQ